MRRHEVRGDGDKREEKDKYEAKDGSISEGNLAASLTLSCRKD